MLSQDKFRTIPVDCGGAGCVGAGCVGAGCVGAGCVGAGCVQSRYDMRHEMLTQHALFRIDSIRATLSQ